MGDTFNNSGDFRGATVFQKTVIGRIENLKGGVSAGDASDAAALDALLETLKTTLANAAPEAEEEAAASC